MITAATVPSWMTAEYAAPGSDHPSSSGMKRRWAVELIGRNSVIPWITPRTIASSKLIENAPGVTSGAQLPRVEVLLLLGGRGVELDAHRLQLQAGDLLVHFRGHRVALPLQLGVVLHHPLSSQRLVGEGHVHHR